MSGDMAAVFLLYFAEKHPVLSHILLKFKVFCLILQNFCSKIWRYKYFYVNLRCEINQKANKI